MSKNGAGGKAEVVYGIFMTDVGTQITVVYKYNTRGRELIIFGFIKKIASYEIKKMHFFNLSTLSSIHLWLRSSNFFSSSKKNYFGCVANKPSIANVAT
jgi:hypothetical protein